MDYLNLILAALSNGIDALYPDIAIYSEWVPDKMPTSCFLLGFAGEVSAAHEIGSRITVAGTLDITYAPALKQDELQIKADINKKFAAISLQLKLITYEGVQLKLRRHRRHDTDDVMHDLCDFTLIIRAVDDTPQITNINIDKEELK